MSVANRYVDEDLDWLIEEEDVPHSEKEKQRINLRAKRALGQMKKKDASDKRIFMRQCIESITSSGEADDEDEARDICELLYEEGEDYDEE